jgi:hypothetical protein
VTHCLGYVSRENHGDYVSKINMRIKQDCTPSKPSELDQVSIFPLKKTIYGSIPWLNAFIDENKNIDLIMNAMMLTKVVFHILQQGSKKGAPNFETHD